MTGKKDRGRLRNVSNVAFVFACLMTVDASFGQQSEKRETGAGEIGKVRKAYLSAVNNGDAAGAASVYAPRGVRVADRNQPPVVGIKNIQAWYKRDFEKISIQEKLTPKQLKVEGKVASEWGVAFFTITDKATKKQTTGRADYLWVLEEQPDDSWKIIYTLVWNVEGYTP